MLDSSCLTNNLHSISRFCLLTHAIRHRKSVQGCIWFSQTDALHITVMQNFLHITFEPIPSANQENVVYITLCPHWMKCYQWLMCSKICYQLCLLINFWYFIFSWPHYTLLCEDQHFRGNMIQHLRDGWVIWNSKIICILPTQLPFRRITRASPKRCLYLGTRNWLILLRNIVRNKPRLHYVRTKIVEIIDRLLALVSCKHGRLVLVINSCSIRHLHNSLYQRFDQKKYKKCQR